MSTSSSPRRKRDAGEAALFPYTELNRSAAGQDASEARQREQEVREAAAREAGRREGEAQAIAQYAAQLQEMRGGLASAIEQFACERRQYFLRAERELVQLALSIARKILHRESSIDPHLLAGMARVLLEQMEQSTKVTVRVHPRQVSDFRMFFAQQTPDRQPEIVEDGTLAPDRCVLQTDFGITETGPEVGLKEIEQGLLDLEAARPHIKP